LENNFRSITKFLLTKNKISETEQSQAFVRGFQPDLWHPIIHRLDIKLPNHDLDDFYPLFEVNEAARHVLHGTSQTKFLQPTTTSSTTSSASSGPPIIKTEDLSAFFDYFAQMLAKAPTPPGSKSKSPQSSPSSSSSTGTSQTSTIENLHCVFCGLQGYFISDCLVCQSYITDGKCKKNLDGKCQGNSP
jgi:hypothetical protein